MSVSSGPGISATPCSRSALIALRFCCWWCEQVAGTSGKVKLDGGSDDQGAACETYGTSIRAALGKERNAEVLSELYVARSDVQYMVRNTALHIWWKTIVVNTPRTLQGDPARPHGGKASSPALADPGQSRSGVGCCSGRGRGEAGSLSLDRKHHQRCLCPLPAWQPVVHAAVLRPRLPGCCCD